MTTRPVARAALAAGLALALAAPAVGQDRPSEEELFGAPPAAAPQQPPAQEAPPPSGKGEAAPARPSEGELFGAESGSPAAQPPPPRAEVSREKEDALKIGGQIYLRAVTTALENQWIGNWRLSSPNLLDTYLDVRPNDRVRGFALGRLFYDPTVIPAAQVTPTSTSLQPLAIFGRTSQNPQGVLDQLWINFDLEHRAFVTAGRQHVKWGVGKFWNPTDYLHPVKRDPLAIFDVRTGTTMVKVHLPWEAKGWNLYAVTVFEDIAGELPRRPDGTPDGTNRLGRLGGGGRAEVVLGGVELGADALLQSGHRPRIGLDVSTGIWDLDVYGEAALRTSTDTPRWRAVPGASPTAPLDQRFERHDPLGFTPQVVAGAAYSVKYSDEDSVTFGAEYFYEHSGYDGPEIYPVLLGVAALSPIPGTAWTGQPNPFTSFYLGKHYGALYASLPKPGSWNNTTFTLTFLGNLSDKSFVSRLDHSVLVLTYLRVETYVAGHFGSREGEFRLGFTIPSQTLSGVTIPTISSAPMVFEAGVALRVSL